MSARNGVKNVFDIVIIGGGILGSFTSFWLHRLAQANGKPLLRIAVVERDRLYRTASVVLSAGGIRQQFSVPENIRLSIDSYRFLRDDYGSIATPEDGDNFRNGLSRIGFSGDGYTFLTNSDTCAGILRENHKLQCEEGANVELVNQAELKKEFPDMNVDDVKLASIGRDNEGWFDPHTLLRDVRRKSISMGTKFIESTVSDLHANENDTKLSGVELEDGSLLSCGTVVNAAGAWSGRIASMAGVELPVEPRLRAIYTFSCPSVAESLGTFCPLIIDPNGVYFRRDGPRGCARFICGVNSPTMEDYVSNNLTIEELDYELKNRVQTSHFEEQIWPVLAQRVDKFAELEFTGCWGGCYDFNTFDHNAVLGPHPTITNFFFASGFSGHGLMMSPSSSRFVAELVLGLEPTVDAKAFNFDRLLNGLRKIERNVI